MGGCGACASSSLGLRLTTSAIDALFRFEPFFAYATEKARERIVLRADAIGVGWDQRVDGMRRNMDKLVEEYDGLLNAKVRCFFGIRLS